MAELRLDPVTRRWIVTGKRLVMPDLHEGGAVCPFCVGHEEQTPKPIFELKDSTGQWTVRVFHDRAPIFHIEGAVDRRGEGMFDRMNTVGAHEILVATPEHGVTLAQLPPEHVTQVIEICRDRILDLKRDRRFRYVSLFKNQSEPSPTAQGHSHSQIIATPVLPTLLEAEFRWAQDHFLKKDRCIFCDIIKQEIQEEKRIVDQNADFIALCPFAARSPYELWVLPLRHASSWERDMSEPRRAASLGPFLKSTLQRVEKISQALHMVVRTEPNLEARGWAQGWWKTVAEDFHWHIEIYPETEGQSSLLGRELFYYNSIPAEEAALVLRALTQEFDSPAAVQDGSHNE